MLGLRAHRRAAVRSVCIAAMWRSARACGGAPC